MSTGKKILFSGMKPTNDIHIGNYIGAIRNWLRFQEDYQCFFSVVDLHALTTPQDPKELRESTYLLYAAYMACGIDQKQSTLFVQSHAPAHSQMAWIMNCAASMGELGRMTQYKDKAAKQESHIPAGIFTYPVLMAGDILLYQTEIVPVGEDQKQHVELTRDIAIRMNNRFKKPLFKIPEPYIAPIGARIMDLQNPLKKMGKSDSAEGGAVYLTDSDKEIEKKFKRAVTDSETEIRFDKDQKPGVSNLLEIQSVFSGKSIEKLVSHYQGKQYGHLKVESAEIAIATIKPIREKITTYMNDRSELDRQMKKSAQYAEECAQKTLHSVYDALGLVQN